MMLRRVARVACTLAVAGAGWSLVPPEGPVRAQNRVDFTRDVMPIFEESCIGCHGPEQQMAGLRLDRRTAISGNRIRPGSSATSRVYLRIRGSEFGQQMPPTGALPAEAIETIKTWVDEGAVWPDALAGEGALPPAIDPGATEIAMALRTDDRRAFSVALARHPGSVNRLAAGAATPLMFASLYGNADAVGRLLVAGADPNVANDRGTTPLMWAVADEAVTRRLLDAGAKAHITNAQNASPVAIAAMRFGAAPIVTLLLERGAAAAPRVEAPQSNRPAGALVMAAAAGNVACGRGRVACEAGPQPSRVIRFRQTPRAGRFAERRRLASSAPRKEIGSRAARRSRTRAATTSASMTSRSWSPRIRVSSARPTAARVGRAIRMACATSSRSTGWR